VTNRQTQKLMDATNLIHAQEPQGTFSSERRPDGTVALSVRPLPPTHSTHTLEPSPSPPQQHLNHYPLQPVRSLQPPIPDPVSLPYNPAYNPAYNPTSPSSSSTSPIIPPIPSPHSTATMVVPSAPPPPLLATTNVTPSSTSVPSFQSDLQKLQFSSHPCPGYVTTLRDEVEEVKGNLDNDDDGDDDAKRLANEAKGDCMIEIVPESGSAPEAELRFNHQHQYQHQYPQDDDNTSKGVLSLPEPRFGNGSTMISAGMYRPYSNPNFNSSSYNSSVSPTTAIETATSISTSVGTLEGNVLKSQERSPHEIAIPINHVPETSLHSSSSPTKDSPPRKSSQYPEMNPNLMPPRIQHNPHEPIIMSSSTSSI
ncbi:hypothetical protein BX616_011243, partial [Lobosporangium transversale]